MNIIETLGLDTLVKRRAEIAANAKHKAETDVVSAVNDAMLDYAERQSSDSKRALERAYEALCALVFRKAINSGTACQSYPLNEILADGRKVREVCTDMLSVIDRVRDIRADIVNGKATVEDETRRIEEMRQKYIVEIEETIARERENLAAAEKELAVAEKEFSALKIRYNVK